LDAAGITADELALRLPSLDDVFLALTGHTSTSDFRELVTEGSLT
jgi:oleandomycin transport system ATP-binding protein